MEFLLSIWYSFDLVTSMKVNHKPAEFCEKRCKEIHSSGDMLMRLTPYCWQSKPLLRLYKVKCPNLERSLIPNTPSS